MPPAGRGRPARTPPTPLIHAHRDACQAMTWRDGLADPPVAPDPGYSLLPAVPSFDLRSDDLAHEDRLPDAHTNTPAGGNVSPHLAWSGFPPQTRSFAWCFDPDAPGPAGWWHWTLLDVPATTTRHRPGRVRQEHDAAARGLRAAQRRRRGRLRQRPLPRRATRCAGTSSSCTRSTPGLARRLRPGRCPARRTPRW